MKNVCSVFVMSICLLSFATEVNAQTASRKARAANAPATTVPPPAAPVTAPQPEPSYSGAQTVTMDQGSSLDRPNAIGFELLGRGLLYTLSYDRMVSEHVAIGAGISYFVTASLFESKILTLPIYANFYFTSGEHRPYLSGGMDIFFANSTFVGYGGTVSGTSVAAVVSGGYEYRGSGGFLFRLAPYLFVGSGDVLISAGATFGYAY